MKSFESRIDKLEKTVRERYGNADEEEAKEVLDDFREKAPAWLKEIRAMFFHLISELVQVELYRNPERRKSIPGGDLTVSFWKDFNFIERDVLRTVEDLPNGEREKIDRVKVQVQFQKVISESDNLSDQTKDDLLKILGSRHEEYHNHLRKIWGLLPLPAEEGGRWKFTGGEWWYDDGILPKWDGCKWVTIRT
jgi:hypothetical protein